jgi:16S rRNA (guanine1516-N2)-methyltransferase
MSGYHKSIGICYEGPDFKLKALELAQRLDCNIMERPDSTFEFILHLNSDGLSLEHTANPMQKPLYLDFTSGKALYRRLHGGGRSQPIAKALGVKSHYKPSIIDATAGLGQDSFVLASLGCEVQMIERSPVIGLLLQDALNRATQDPETAIITSRMHLHLANAEAIIPSLAKADVIYLDPMFPDENKTALAKKGMQILQALLEKTDDKALLTVALAHAKRVVVKRPKNGPLLNDQIPSLQMIGSSNRFDIYLNA